LIKEEKGKGRIRTISGCSLLLPAKQTNLPYQAKPPSQEEKEGPLRIGLL